MSDDNLQQDVKRRIEEVVACHPDNRHLCGGNPIFEAPCVGFAEGNDPLFKSYKTIIGPFHLTPLELLQAAGFSQATCASVVCWILPVARETRASNRKQRKYPSKLWAHTRYYGELFNDVVRREVSEFIRARGAVAVAPVLEQLFKVHRSNDDRPIGSNWSERHIMYAAGLGTFSVNDGFITERGIAMRCGSVVTDLQFQPTPRIALKHDLFCRYRSKGECGRCMQRCPAGAITAGGHDKQRCEAYIREIVGPAVQQAYAVKTTGCGLCQTAVPCEARIP